MKLVFIDNQRPVTDSLTIAETFGKEHARVLRDIRELTCSEQFRVGNFAESTYTNGQGREMPRTLITFDGFMFLAMGYTGIVAAQLKEDYITEFNRMREELKPQFKLPQTMVEAVESYLIELKRSEQLELQNQQLAIENTTQKQQLREQETPIAIYNLAIAAQNTQSMADVAKALGTGRTRLFGILREEGIIPDSRTVPYQRYIESGYFVVRERPRASGDTVINDPVPRVTAKGFDYIARLLQKRSNPGA